MDLDGLRVLDLTRLLPGPYATQLLADCGADVVKVEEPGTGDPTRTFDATLPGPGLFPSVNRGKRSVAIDLASDRGREAFLAVAETADVVVEGFKPGTAARLGVGYDDVVARNPDVVYCSLSGFGATGPHRDRPGHDLNYVGMAGLLDMTRSDPDADPQIPGYPIGDMAGGLFAAFAVLGAVLSRELGEAGGEHLDVSMTDAVAAFSQAVAPDALDGDPPRPGETPLSGSLPCYDVYETADGEYVTLAALEPRYWEAFCEAVDRPDLVGDQYAPDEAVRDVVREEVAAVFADRTRDEWETLLGDAGVMVAPVDSPREALTGAHAEARDLVVGDPPRVGLPFHSSASVTGSPDTVPDVGEHTAAVLERAGYDPEAVAALREDGVVE
jgi:alpha-methylacyl-CoA racemase